MANSTYLGIPITEPDGTKAVKRVRAIQDPATGLYFKGIVGVDTNGNKFVYNKVPDDYSVDISGFSIKEKL